MALNIEVAELMKKPGRVYSVAEKTQYNLPMDAEDKEIAEVCEAHINELIDRGDPDREIAQFVNRTVTDDTYNAPDELLDAMFTRGNVGENDNYQAERNVKNTLVAHEAAKGGNVPKSYLHFEVIKPTWKNIQVETDISFNEIRRNGWKSIATLTTYMSETLKNKMFYDIFGMVDDMITGGDQLITVAGKEPTMESMDALTLYLNEYADGANPFTVSLQKYCAKMRRMTGYAQYLSDASKDEFNRYGLVKTYDGVAVTGISSAKRLGDGSMLLPDARIFGIGGVVGNLDMKGETHTYEDYDNNNEKVHLMLKDFSYGYCITHPERVAKIVLQK